MKNKWSKYTDLEIIEIFEHKKHYMINAIELIEEITTRLKNKTEENKAKHCSCGQKLTKFRDKEVCSAALTGCNEIQNWIEE